MVEQHGLHGHSQGQSSGVDSPYMLRVLALEELLSEKEVLTSEEVRQEAQNLDSRSYTHGARAVARAWVAKEFKARLLSDAKGPLVEFGYHLPDKPGLVVLENTQDVHHLIVCTLCSCYPRNLLGRPPDWYKSLAYRSRAAVDPRGVIQEFGLALPESAGPAVEHPGCPPPDSVYPLFVLPSQPSGPASRLVQEPGLPLQGRGGPSGGDTGVRPRSARVGEHTGGRQHRRRQVHGLAPKTS